MLLSKIIEGDYKDIEITGIQSDSRLIQKDNIFFAINGRTVKGISFAEKVIEMGASVIVCGSDEDYTNDNIVVIKVDDVLGALGKALSNFYKEKPEHIVGITGTSGKTSTAEFTRQALQILGKNSASIGSLGLRFGDEYEKNDTLTMKELVDLHTKLNFLKTQKATDYVAMEATSQGLDQRRLEAVKVEMGVFLNITPEHLDYHADMEDYLQKKLLLFTNVLQKNSKVVLNADIPEYDKIADVCKKQGHQILSFGKNGDLQIISIKNGLYGQDVVLKYKDKNYNFNSSFIGSFQIYNLLATLGILIGFGFDVDAGIKALEQVKAAHGRLELAGKKSNGATIYIDYAHKPDALEKMLKAMKEQISGEKDARVGVLFGCGGDRDKTKRPVMGKIACDLADFVILTSDNCRTEDPNVILSEVKSGCNDKVVITEIDRKIAIQKAIDFLQPKDVLVLAGKGHENYTIIGKEQFPFNEFEIVKEYIK